MRHGEPLPRGAAVQGIYIDDLVIFGYVKRGCAQAALDGEDLDLLRKARRAYKEIGWPTSAGKAFEAATKFVAWGVEVDGNHAHFRCLGNVRVEGHSVAVSRAAGHYPQPFTKAWAQIVKGALSGDGPVGPAPLGVQN